MTDPSAYVAAIVREVEPAILTHPDALRDACPSYGEVCRRGYADRLQVACLADIEAINALYRERDRRNAAGERWEVDHVVPLFAGGLHAPSNLQLLTYAEHRAKSGQERRKRPSP